MNRKQINTEQTGLNLWKLLEEKQIPVKVVAKELDVSLVAVYKWLKGESKPTLEHLVQISQLLNTKISDIIKVS